jgi:hypothetical protein
LTLATKDEILNAVEIVDDFAGKPSVGFVRETLDRLTESVTEVVETPVDVVDSTKTTKKTSDTTTDVGSDSATA